MAKRFRPVPPESVVTSEFGPRWGTVHRGVDFGKVGGSANMPVYAAQGGTVVYAGAASGFGGPDPAGWVVIDHPTDDGAGTTVYGHIIREVGVGDRVEAGQRIGRVNPNSATNGGVAPHLHFEVHPYVWSPGAQLNPLQWLGNSPSPGANTHVATPGASEGTIFGVDVSEHQNGMSLVRAKDEGMTFAIIRTTDGTYKDSVYASHYDDAKNAGLDIAAYHYLRAPREGTTVAQQVEASLAVMGTRRAPMWIDVETAAGLHVNDIRECKTRFEAAGIRVIGVYSYVPYWENQVAPSEPDSHEFGAFWVAAYGRNPVGAPRAIYPGNNHGQWHYPLGNQKPILWQFGSNALVAGFKVDINAFNGSREQLRELFNGKGESSEPKPVEKAPEPVSDGTTGTPGAPTPPVETKPVETPVTPNPPMVEKRTVLDLILDTLVSLIVGRRPF